MPSMELRTRSGRKPEDVFLNLGTALTPNSSDMALAGQLVRSDIRERTARGVDVDGTPFEPYSTKGPYYYNPGRRGGKLGKEATSKGSAKRLSKKLGDGSLSSTGRTIKFASYAAFKAAFGRGNVDLLGVAAPHMLDAIVVRVNGADTGASSSEEGSVLGGQSDTLSLQRADTVTIGIYDPECAARASGHQYGTRTLPVRKFFGASSEVRERIMDMLKRRILTRARKVSKQ